MQNNFQIVSASVSDRGLSDKRPENEDSFLEVIDSGIFAVADGVGGAQAGDVASQMAMEIVGEAFINLQSASDAEEMMKTAIERANEAIFQMSNELPQLSTMATTIVALHLNGNIATIGHVGDSRLYRIDGNGTLYRETQDHSVVEEEVRAGRMTQEQAANHPSRNIISRALGAEPNVEVDLKTMMIDPNTTFLVCSDGITRHITDDEINALLFSTQQPADICQRMKEICYDRGAEDNLTAVVVRVLEVSKSIETAPADYEQDTIATARQTLAATAATSGSASAEKPETLQNPDGKNYETQKLSSEDQMLIPADQPAKENYSSQYIEAPKNKDSIQDKDRTVISVDEEKHGSNIFGKFIGGLTLLLLGAILGAAGYYLFAKKEVAIAPPVSNSPVPNNIESKSFFDLVAQADANPQQAITASQNIADSPEEFYVLGRSHMMLKNYPEAKKNLTEAKNRLAMADKSNAKILATEIAMALAIINGPFSIREFEKELPVNESINANVNNTENVNNNSLQPVNGQGNAATNF